MAVTDTRRALAGGGWDANILGDIETIVHMRAQMLSDITSAPAGKAPPR